MPKSLLPAAALMLLLAARPLPLGAETARPWALTVYTGQTTFTRFVDVIRLHTDSRGSYLAALAISREFARWGPDFSWEWEGNVVRHWGMQHHFEFNAIVTARWHRFPWNERLPTTFALGAGPSYALEKPPVETAQHDKVSKLLNQLTAELSFAPPGPGRWSVLARVHHRSGAGGTIHGVWGGSNFYCLGWRYRF